MSPLSSGQLTFVKKYKRILFAIKIVKKLSSFLAAPGAISGHANLGFGDVKVSGFRDILLDIAG